MSEKLADKLNYVDDEGDVKPLDAMEEPVTYSHYDPTEYPVRKVELSEMEPNYMVRKALAAQALVIDPIEAKADHPKELDPSETLHMLYEANHFYPQSSKEKNSMVAIQGRSGKAAFPAVMYLSEVYAQQLKANTDTPANAVHSIVESFYKYAHNSRANLTLGKELEERLDRPTTDFTSLLVNQPDYKDWVNDDTMRRALTNIAQFKEIDDFANGLRLDSPLGKNTGVNSTVGRERTAAIKAVVGDLHIKTILELNEKVNEASKVRFHYWKDKLAEATMQPEARPVAHGYLERLGK